MTIPGRLWLGSTRDPVGKCCESGDNAAIRCVSETKWRKAKDQLDQTYGMPRRVCGHLNDSITTSLSIYPHGYPNERGAGPCSAANPCCTLATALHSASLACLYFYYLSTDFFNSSTITFGPLHSYQDACDSITLLQ